MMMRTIPAILAMALATPFAACTTTSRTPNTSFSKNERSPEQAVERDEQTATTKTVAEPLIVPPVALEAQRISGNKDIQPDEPTERQFQRKGQTGLIASVRICISASGSVSDLKVTRSSGSPSYDLQITTAMREWRYAPIMLEGKPSPACSLVHFVFQGRVTAVFPRSIDAEPHAQRPRQVIDGLPTSVPGPEVPAPQGSIKGLIRPTAQTRIGIPKGAVIFVLVHRAHPETGNPMGTPLAVKRLRFLVWPTRFEITEQDALVAGTRLEGEVVITAWADQDQDPVTKMPGDIQGRTKAIIPIDDLEVALDTVIE